MKHWLKEPLLHFLVLGLFIFILYEWRSPGLPSEDEIVVTRGQQEHLVTAFSRTWQRPPSSRELTNLIDDWIREEIAYRESQLMGLDANDVIIRRRLRQKLETLAEDIVSMAEPEEAQLQAFLEANRSEYLAEPWFSLKQVFFSLDRREDRAMDDAQDALRAIRAADPSSTEIPAGDPLPLPSHMERLRSSAIAAQFGQVFVDHLQGLPDGQWQGPIRSGYGLHLVYIEASIPGRELTIDEARDALIRDWSSEQRNLAIDRLYERLAERYEIIIEPMADMADES